VEFEFAEFVEMDPTVCCWFLILINPTVNYLSDFIFGDMYLFTPTEAILKPLKRPKLEGKIAFISTSDECQL